MRRLFMCFTYFLPPIAPYRQVSNQCKKSVTARLSESWQNNSLFIFKTIVF